MVAAVRADVDAVFVSPLFDTRSHPGARTLGRPGAMRLIRGVTLPVVALGGMTARRYRSLPRRKFHGWAAIDAWLG